MTVALEQLERIVGKAQLEQRAVGAAAARTSASKPSPLPRRRRLPGFGDLLARSCASTRRSGPIRSTRTSTAPPLAFAPSRRALIDAGVVDDEQVAVAQQPRQIAEDAVDALLRRVPSSSREPLRSAAGCCAISSGGSAKSKSLSV